MKTPLKNDHSAKNNVSRRKFLDMGLSSSAVLCFGCGRANSQVPSPGGEPKEALYYEKLAGGAVRCHVCPRECLIKSGQRGFCGTRENRDGVLYSLVYGRVASYAVDPIEKKPLFHVMPGSLAFSICTAGCNMWCKFCQNYTLSQSKPEELRSIWVTPERLADEARRTKSTFIAYTYNEPTVFTEFAHDCSKAGLVEGVHSVVISNGYINPEPLDKLCEVITAYKVDLKSFSKTFYREVTGGERDPVLATIKRLRKNEIWTELVHLTIPTLNDNEDDFREMGKWLMGEVGPDVPVHFTRFHPQYKLTNLPATPVSTLERARDILMDAGMNFVYVGNVPGHKAESTYCPKCGKNIIERGRGYIVGAINIKAGKCAYCGTAIPGVWSV